VSDLKQTTEEARLAEIIVAALDIDDIEAADVVPTAALFDPDNAESLGLDSIDALEISLAIDKHFNVQLEAENEANKEIFFSLRSLTEFVMAQADG
jgi:acyl carrier protein